jgi:hypothetical protein
MYNPFSSNSEVFQTELKLEAKVDVEMGTEVKSDALTEAPVEPPSSSPLVFHEEPDKTPGIDTSDHKVHYNESNQPLCKYVYREYDTSVIAKRKEVGEKCKSCFVNVDTGYCNTHYKVVYGGGSKDTAIKNSIKANQVNKKKRIRRDEVKKEEGLRPENLVNWLSELNFKLRRTLPLVMKSNPTGDHEGNLKYALALWVISPTDKREPADLTGVARLFKRTEPEVQLWLTQPDVGQYANEVSYRLEALYAMQAGPIIAEIAIDTRERWALKWLADRATAFSQSSTVKGNGSSRIDLSKPPVPHNVRRINSVAQKLYSKGSKLDLDNIAMKMDFGKSTTSVDARIPSELSQALLGEEG